MELKEVIEKDYGIVVNNKEEYDRLAKILDEAGLRWLCGDSYIGYHDRMHDFPFYIRPSKGSHGMLAYVGELGSASHAISLSDLKEYQDQTELERLRCENAELKAQLSQRQPKDEWPKVGDEYCVCNIDGGTLVFKWNNDDFDKAILSIGNVHRTKEAAEAWFERKQLEHKMNEGGKVQVYERIEGGWDFVECSFSTNNGFFASKESAQAFLSDPKNIELLNKHLR